MRKAELIQRLQDIEWEDFEVKEAKTDIPKNSWETVSAFANTAGGWLIFGVKKKGNSYEIVGVQDPGKIEQDFTTCLRNGTKFNKPIDVTSKKYNFPEGTVLAFYIPQKSKRDKPIYINAPKNTFIRSASGDQRATQEEIDTFFRTSSFEEKDGEKTQFTIKDLDQDTIKQYRTYFSVVNPGHRYNRLPDEEFLEKLGVLSGKKVTYGGLLVFGTEDTLAHAIPKFKIDYLEIPGKSYEDAPTRYSQRILSEKNLFSTFFDLYEQISKKIDVPFSVKGGFRDDDPPQLQAIREALVNLIIHADYFSQSTPRIRFFIDRYEFYNPGGLPKDIEYILKEDFSLPRNPIIAKTFRFIKLSENIGSGFSKMINGWMRAYKLKPIIDSNFDFYKITFPTTNKTTTKTINKPSNKESKEKMILRIIERNPLFTAEEIAQQVDLTVNGVRYHIKNLKQKNLLKRVGSKRTGKWEVKK